MSNYELYEHKRSDTVKWVLTLISFILVGVMLAGIILGWFEKDDAEEEQAGAPAYSFIVGNGEGNRMSLTSVRNSAVTGESVTITATVEPDNEAENTGVDWTAAWKNAESVWASGKSVSDYVTLTPGGENYAASKSDSLSESRSSLKQRQGTIRRSRQRVRRIMPRSRSISRSRSGKFPVISAGIRMSLWRSMQMPRQLRAAQRMHSLQKAKCIRCRRSLR